MPTPTGPRAPLIGTAELRDHLEDALDHWFAGTRGWLPAFDLIRRPSELVLRADVPGVKFDDVRIEVDAATLTISGERPEPDEAEDATYLREERRCGPFLRRLLALSARIDATKIDTRLEDGVRGDPSASPRVGYGADPDQAQSMSGVNRSLNRLTRQKAAERLTDIAYALTTGGRLKLGDEEGVSIPAADHVALKCETEVGGRPRRARDRAQLGGMTVSGATRQERREVEVSISIRTILIVAAIVAIAFALGSIGDVLLLLFVSVFSIAVLSPVAAAMERRLGWSRRAVRDGARAGNRGRHRPPSRWVISRRRPVGAVRGASATNCRKSSTRPGTADSVTSSTRGSGCARRLDEPRGRHHQGAASSVSGGVAHVGISAFGAVTLHLLGDLPHAVRADRGAAPAGMRPPA